MVKKKKKQHNEKVIYFAEKKEDKLRLNQIEQILILLIILGFYIRFITLTFNPLWLDEGSTWIISKLPFSEIWKAMTEGEFNPPLFYWIEHIMMNLFGETEVALRLVPFIAGVVAIPVTYYLGKELLNEKAGIIGATLMTLSPWAIVYSQEARTYTLSMVLFAISFVYWLRTTKTSKNLAIGPVSINPNALIFAITGAIAFWTHFYALIFVGILFLVSYSYYLYKKNVTEIISWIVAGGLFTIIILPLLIVLKDLLFTRMEASTGKLFGVTGWLVVTQTFYQLSGFSWYTAFIIIALLPVGFLVLYKYNKINAISIASLLSISFIVSMIVAPYINMVPRYLCYMLPVLFAVSGSSYPMFTPGFKTPKPNYIVSICIVAILVLTTVPALYSSYTVQFKNDWRGAAKYLDENAHEGDIIALIPGYVHQPLRFYYNETEHNTPFKLVYNMSDVQRVYDSRDGHLIYYLISNDIVYSSDTDAMISWLQSHASDYHQLNAVDIVVVQ